ncbi:MAG: hypothetical protein OEW58_05165 [Gammaproteobacteria bacterium]|nr:hypothetical protein [Gammaproteobacteria bacterium]
MEINIYVLYGLVEAVIVLAALVVYLYFRQRKLKTYALAQVDEREFHKRYFKKLIKETRDYAKKLNAPAEAGDNTAIKYRQHMVARLNWLSLERDFVCIEKPNDTYWTNINRKIAQLLNRWQQADLVDGPPDTRIIDQMIENSELIDDTQIEHHHNKNSVEINYDSQAQKEIEKLKKQLRNLNGYKALYHSQQNAYAKMVDSYKKLKHSLTELELESGNSEKLRKLLSQHEMTENMMEDQMKEMEKQQERLNAELQQLEAVFNLQQQELDKQFEEKPTEQPPAEPSAPLPEKELDQVHALIDQQNSAIRELKTTVLSLNVETDVRLELEEHLDKIEKNSSELQTCLQMLELERERLNSELTNMRHDETVDVSNMLNNLDGLDDPAPGK